MSSAFKHLNPVADAASQTAPNTSENSRLNGNITATRSGSPLIKGSSNISGEKTTFRRPLESLEMFSPTVAHFSATYF